ncbi:response regulator [Sphingomonas sp. RHCKR7]|uniref:response regulator n=1 Tax=Sphingomonas folli TaxID=2862497 RepID=UPI001CA5D3DA|nr:response regulator [Sphingomonas folli]MBW6527960.1 response regulator [Sphingomonas folli]
MAKTALIVEDEIFVALDLERILEDAGFIVAAIAADAESAYRAAPGCQFAFVDVNLRDGATGPVIAERIAREHGVKVVFVTANPGQITDPGSALGYIRKPFNDEAILSAALTAAEMAPADAASPADFVRWPRRG